MATSAGDGRGGTSRASDERGASLIIVLVIMMLGGLTVAALMLYAQTSLRTAKVYKDRTDEVQLASDAIDLALAEIRYDRAKGSAASPTLRVTRRAEESLGEARCESQPNSGVGTADREVKCVGSVDSKDLMTAHVRIIDLNGTNVGAQLEMLQRKVLTEGS